MRLPAMTENEKQANCSQELAREDEFESYSVRLERLRAIYADADSAALAKYKVRYPEFWRQDLCACCSRHPPEKFFAGLFARDAADFFEGLDVLMASYEFAWQVTKLAVAAHAYACAEWLFKCPRPTNPTRTCPQNYNRLPYNRRDDTYYYFADKGEPLVDKRPFVPNTATLSERFSIVSF